ncbi:MAG: glycosyltransferase family 1 protein, partial [Nitrospirae bacterium]
AISNLVKENIIEHYGVDEKLIDVIYNAVDLERFYPENKKRYRNEVRETYGIPQDRIVILFVGSGFERKGLSYLIKAVELIKEPLTLMVVGKGKSEKLKKLIKRQQVIFCGPQKNIERFYASADIFAFPTIYEPFGNVHLEALASGLPVITTVLSGASEIITDGKEGFVLKNPEDTVTLKTYIEHFMDETILKQMSENARSLAERFSFDRHIEETLRLYKSVISQKSRDKAY